MGHASTRAIGSYDERTTPLSRSLGSACFVLPTPLFTPTFLLALAVPTTFFSLCHRNSFSADLDGQASYANCRFFWPENQLWPTVQQVSCWWVTANFYLSVRAREVGEKREGEEEEE